MFTNLKMLYVKIYFLFIYFFQLVIFQIHRFFCRLLNKFNNKLIIRNIE